MDAEKSTEVTDIEHSTDVEKSTDVEERKDTKQVTDVTDDEHSTDDEQSTDVFDDEHFTDVKQPTDIEHVKQPTDAEKSTEVTDIEHSTDAEKSTEVTDIEHFTDEEQSTEVTDIEQHKDEDPEDGETYSFIEDGSFSGLDEFDPQQLDSQDLVDSDPPLTADQVQGKVTHLQPQPELPQLPFQAQVDVHTSHASYVQEQQQQVVNTFQTSYVQQPMIPFQQQQQQQQQPPFFQGDIYTSQASYVQPPHHLHAPAQLPQLLQLPQFPNYAAQGYSSLQPLFSGPFQNFQTYPTYDCSGYQQQMQMLPQYYQHQMHPPPSASAVDDEPPLKKFRPSTETIATVISSRPQSPSQWQDLSNATNPSTGSKFFSQSDANVLEALFSESKLRNGLREIAMVSQGQFDTKDFKLYKIEDYVDETKNMRTLRIREIKNSMKEVSFPMQVNMECWNKPKCKCNQHKAAYLKSINFQVVRKAIGVRMLFVVKDGYIY
jgi:hypothetical protein